MKLANVLGHQVIRLALITSMALGGFPAVRAQQKAAATSTTGAHEKSASGRTEGIKVHGHWTITVRNADGSVASRNEFENSLNPGTGSAALVQILGRTATPGLWEIFLGTVDSAGTTQSLSMFEAASTVPVGPKSFKGLLVSADAAGLHLSGTAKAAIAQPTATINAVSTYLYLCPATAEPAAPCADIGALVLNQQITTRFLSSAIPIQQNQSIDVTVTITFS
jgi:hypothetical protein